MDKTLISIIVPVYNVEKYINRCLDSIIRQTYKNIEIIIVDDGSTDNSGKICDEYLKIDNRVIVVHKENLGLSDARNKGIEKSTGEYLCFIDSDDYIEHDMIENLYNALKKDMSDIACCAKVLEYEKRQRIINNKENFCINSDDALSKMLLYNDIDTSACDKIFKRELFNNIYFPIGKYYEDMGTIYKIFEKANKISHINNVGYHYCIRKNSLSKEKFSKTQLDALKFAKEIKEHIEETKPNLKEEAEHFYYLALFDTIIKMKKSNNFNEIKEDYKEVKKIYNKNILNMIKNIYLPYHKKIMAICIYFKFYKIVILLKNN